MSNQIKLSGHNAPRPPTISIVKELKVCPRCGASKKQGFDIKLDKTLTLGAACYCECGYGF